MKFWADNLKIMQVSFPRKLNFIFFEKRLRLDPKIAILMTSPSALAFSTDGLLFFDGLGRGLAGQSLYRICEGREGTGRWARGGRWAARPRFCSSRFSPALCLHFASNTTVPVEMDCHHSDRFAALVSHVLRSIPVTLRKPV